MVSMSGLAGLISLAGIRFEFASLFLDIRFHFGPTLPVAGGAAGYVLRCPQMILLRYGAPQRCLACIVLTVELHRAAAGRLLVTHIEDFFFGPQKFFRLPVTVQAPLHL